jgi:glycosyltransferase involved in cell wall biosynthesis
VTSATVLIVEPYATGHRGIWLRWISDQLVIREWRIVIATLAETLHQPAFAWLAGRPGAIDVVAINLPGDYSSGGSVRTLLEAELRTYRLLKRLCTEARRRHHVDALLLPFGDYATHFTSFLGSPFGGLPWIPIMMRPAFHYRTMGIAAPKQAYASLRLALFRSFVRTRSLSTCFTIDQPLWEFMCTDPQMARKLRYLADPVDTIELAARDSARVRLGIPAEAVVVLVYGSLTSKKGVKYLLPAIITLQRPELHVLCVGVPDLEFRMLLRGCDARTLIEAGRLHVLDKWADHNTEAAAFGAADIVWLGYVDHWQSSGVMVQAGHAQLPSIACDTGLIGWTVTRQRSGLVVPVRVQDAVTAALQRLAALPELRRSLGSNGRHAFAAHSTHNAGAMISDALRCAVTGTPLAAPALNTRVSSATTLDFPEHGER